MPHQLFTAVLQARESYSDLKKYFYKEHSNVTWEEFLTIKFWLWIDTCSSTDSSSAVKKSDTLLQIEKAPEVRNGDRTCHVFSLEDPAGF